MSYKVADESRTSTTVSSDTNLTVTVTKNTVYSIEAFLWIVGTPLKLTFGGGATATNIDIINRCLQTQFTGAGFNRTTAIGGAGVNQSTLGTGNNAIMSTGTIEVNAGGVFALQWASNDGTSVTLKRGSWMNLRRIK
jgi:hypothetical protein